MHLFGLQAAPANSAPSEGHDRPYFEGPKCNTWWYPAAQARCVPGCVRSSASRQPGPPWLQSAMALNVPRGRVQRVVQRPHLGNEGRSTNPPTPQSGPSSRPFITPSKQVGGLYHISIWARLQIAIHWASWAMQWALTSSTPQPSYRLQPGALGDRYGRSPGRNDAPLRSANVWRNWLLKNSCPLPVQSAAIRWSQQPGSVGTTFVVQAPSNSQLCCRKPLSQRREAQIHSVGCICHRTHGPGSR